MEDEFPSKEISTFESVKALSRHMSELPNDLSDEDKNVLYETLWRIAYSYLLKKEPVTETLPVVEDVPLELLAILVYEKSRRSEWTPTEYEKVSGLMDSFEAFTKSGKYDWLTDVGKFLIALNHLRPQDDDNPPADLTQDIVPSLGGIQNIPPAFRLPESPFSHTWKAETPCAGHLIKSFVSKLQRMRVPMAESVIEWVSKTDESTEAGQRRLVSPSTSHEDEGFSSPSARASRHHKPFDWSQFSIDERELHRTWESFQNMFHPSGLSTSKEHCPICRMIRLRKNIELSPFELNKLQHSDLMTHVKALLVGIPSDVFKKVGGEFVMMPALYTEETPPNVMLSYFQWLREAGTLFAQLHDLDGQYPCETSSSMKSTIKQFILDYHAVILSISDHTSLLKVILDVIPFIELLRYLAELLKAVLEPDDENALKGWMLLQKLYQDVCASCHPSIFRLTSALFLSCCQAYYKFIDDWIFEGRWHRDLFFTRNSPVEPIEDRLTWKRMYRFSPKNAPTFLPSQFIFDCGMTVHLTRRKHHLENDGLDREACPRVRLITDSEELDLAKFNSEYYVKTGDALEVELFKIFNDDHDVDVLQIAVDKAAMDALKYDKSLVEAYALKVAERNRKVQAMKQELAEYEAHKNLQSLKDNIMELLEDDKIALAQLLQLISSTSLRYELIERFVQLQTHNLKRAKVNLWKERRYALNSSRAEYWESLGEGLVSIFKGLTMDRGAPAEFLTEVDAGQMHFSLKFPDHTESESVEKTLHYTPAAWQFTPISGPSCSSVATPQNTDLTTPASPSIENYYTPADFWRHPLTSSPSSPYVTPEYAASSSSAGTLPQREIPSGTSLGTPLGSGESSLLHSSDEQNIEPPHCCHSAAYNSDPFFGHDVGHFHHSMQKMEDDMQCNDEQTKIPKITTLKLKKSSLHYFTMKSLEYPLAAHSRVLNNSVMHELFIEHDFLGHLKRLKNILLRDDGVTALALTDRISTILEVEIPANLLVYHKLNGILNQAFIADSDHIAPKVDSTPPAFDCVDPTIFRCVTLVYLTSWPINLILTEPAVSRYNDAFHLLFSLDRTLWYLHQATRSLVFSRMATERNITQIQLQLHVMLVIVNGLRNYAGSAVQECWDTFYKALKTTKNHEELYKHHVAYVKSILRRFMLNRSAARLHLSLWRVLKNVLSYCQVVKVVDWQRCATDRSYFELRAKKLVFYHTCFRNLVNHALIRVDHLVQERGYTHLIVLSQLLRLD